MNKPDPAIAAFKSNRRQVLRQTVGLCAAGIAPVGSPALARTQTPDATTWISSCGRGRRQYALAAVGGAGRYDADGPQAIPLPVRAHAMAIHPTRKQAVAMARRPGTMAWVIALPLRTQAALLRTPRERHFLGHAVYSPDGKTLFTTENAYNEQRSVIGLWDTDTWQRIGELPTHGIGAHALHWMPDNQTLAVCNGGILTHPAFPRKKLNLDTMQPSLVYLDARSGQLIDEYRPAHHRLSVRHLDVSHDGTVVLAMQMQQADGTARPLLARHRGEPALVSTEIAEPLSWHLFNDYIGDVSLSADGQWAGVTSPRGGVLGFWHVAENRIVQLDPIADVCGIGFDPANGSFLASAGTGSASTYRLDESRWTLTDRKQFAGFQWDNHLSILS